MKSGSFAVGNDVEHTGADFVKKSKIFLMKDAIFADTELFQCIQAVYISTLISNTHINVQLLL